MVVHMAAAEGLVDSYAAPHSPPNLVEYALPTHTLLGSKRNADDVHANADDEEEFHRRLISHA
jgi:hypothetical protein